MKSYVFLVLVFFSIKSFCQTDESPKVIHVFVALCDNVHQGIIPVSESLGNGQDPNSNLYWGALYGVKTHFEKSNEWRFVKTIIPTNSNVLQRVLLAHKTSNVFMIADAYDGKFIKNMTIDFLRASGGSDVQKVCFGSEEIRFGGASNLIAYVGHNGLMDFNLENTFESCQAYKDVIIMACASKDYFSPYISKINANPILWSTGLMAPEAYILEAIIDGWVKNKTTSQIKEDAAQSYHKFQGCGISAARNLLVTGF